MSWTQNRANLPGWYGLREGLEAIGPELGGEMYQRWPFFRSILDNAQMSLAKSDLLIFEEYTRLIGAGETERLGLAADLEAAYRATVQAVQTVVGAELLSAEPRLKRSIELRNPYIDPIHRLQVELLRRSRGLEGGSAGMPTELERPLLLSVQGISAGVRNTG